MATRPAEQRILGMIVRCQTSIDRANEQYLTQHYRDMLKAEESALLIALSVVLEEKQGRSVNLVQAKDWVIEEIAKGKRDHE